MVKERIYNVLFLCVGNSARSIIAEALLEAEGKGRFHAYSAGSQPRGEVNPLALDMLVKTGLPVEGLKSKSWSEFVGPDAPEMDFVITVCDNAAGEVCPVWPGQPMNAHWGVPDPAACEGDEVERHLAFADCYRMLRNRIGLFVNLPLASLDRLSLRSHMDNIGALCDPSPD
ncbi:MAG TPA: arsenate reductase ArsC [Rhodocyclaceae bacterium]|nr:arsenate reductase ArsC [Rhodocyclaceae bacterium]